MVVLIVITGGIHVQDIPQENNSTEDTTEEVDVNNHIDNDVLSMSQEVCIEALNMYMAGINNSEMSFQTNTGN